MDRLDLREALAALVKEGTRYPGTRETFLADFALYGFVTDVREQAQAVDLISASEMPRAAFANARAALEAAVDAAYLAKREDDYLFRGSQARVAEVYEVHEIEKRAAPFDTQLGELVPKGMHPDDIISADASAWDKEVAGRGYLLRRAWEDYTKNAGASRLHWSLRPKEDVFDEVFGGGSDQAIGGMAQILHALLSIASHPRMRAGSREIEYREDGGILIGTRRTDATMARKIAALACRLATSALQYRRTFFAPAT